MIFLAGGRSVTFVTPTRVYRKCHISMYFSRKVTLRPPPKEKISCFREKIPLFRIIQERSYSSAIFLKRPSFQTSEKKYHKKNIMYFFEKDHLSFSVQGVRSYFREKEISSFAIIQERSYSSTTFLERPPFQGVWKKKIWLSVQCKGLCFSAILSAP